MPTPEECPYFKQGANVCCGAKQLNKCESMVSGKVTLQFTDRSFVTVPKLGFTPPDIDQNKWLSFATESPQLLDILLSPQGFANLTTKSQEAVSGIHSRKVTTKLRRNCPFK